MLLLAPPLCFLVVVAGLFAVGLVSWRRTASLRGGTIPRAGDEPVVTSFTSSRTTVLAATAGVTAIVWGASAASRGGIEALPMIAGGTFIAIAGSVARVTGIRVGDDAVVILFAARPSFRARWADISGLRPPATPLGGWRLTVAGGIGATLMPSDLFGHEEVLTLIVGRARLWFDGRKWVGRRDLSRRGW